MATKQNTVDWGGITHIVKELKLATKPGQSGTAATISSTELGFLDAVTAGTGAVSKALVLDANGDVAMPAAGLITGKAVEIVDDGTTVALTAAQSGAIVHLNSGAAAAFTLPAAAAGLEYRFFVGVTTHASTTVTCTEGDFFVGSVVLHDSDTAAVDVVYTADGTADDVLTLNGTTTGGVAGTWFDLVCISATQWLIRGHLINSGDDADCFTAP